jgi:hypothetical protein
MYRQNTDDGNKFDDVLLRHDTIYTRWLSIQPNLRHRIQLELLVIPAVPAADFLPVRVLILPLHPEPATNQGGLLNDCVDRIRARSSIAATVSERRKQSNTTREQNRHCA